MVNRKTEKPRRVFMLGQLRPSHLETILSWVGDGGFHRGRDEDDRVIRERAYAAFRCQYKPLWHSGEVDLLVMTLNRVPVFCMSVLRMARPDNRLQGDGSEAHIHLLCRPEIRRSDRLLLLAWQAATVHAFLKMGFQRVQTAVDADAEENEALVMLGYKLIESISETSGTTNVYVCGEQDLRMAM